MGAAQHAENIPVWDPETCIQCGDCSAVCPHSVIRMKIYEPALLANAPKTFKSTGAKGKEFEVRCAHPDRPGRLHGLRRMRQHLPRV
jgi:Fe-S-cluster-containing hydrogenase component 2